MQSRCWYFPRAESRLCPWTTRPLGSLCSRLLGTPGGPVTPSPGRERQEGGVEGGTRNAAGRPPGSRRTQFSGAPASAGRTWSVFPPLRGCMAAEKVLGQPSPSVVSLQLVGPKRQQGSRPLFSRRLEGAAAPEASPSGLLAAVPGDPRGQGPRLTFLPGGRGQPSSWRGELGETLWAPPTSGRRCERRPSSGPLLFSDWLPSLALRSPNW